MNKKSIIISCILSIIIVVLYTLNEIYSVDYMSAEKSYKVYLNGNTLGLIQDKQELYDLINEKQQEIKNRYNVDYVYPPNGLDVVEVNTFNNDYLSADDIYEKIQNVDDFTIKGYIITIKPKEGDNIVINVLDKKIFEDALKKFVLAFITEEQYYEYQHGSTDDLTEVGSVIQNMYFNETITVRDGYISVNDTIYDNVDTLSQYLLFGPDAKMDSYEVEIGDSIESISEKYKLNPQEFIIANPIYRDVKTMLRVGEKVNVTLLDPIVTFVYDVYRVEENEVAYSTDEEVDSSKPYGYREPIKAGVTGIELNHEKFEVVNGEQSSEVEIVNTVVVREAQDAVYKVGKKNRYQAISGSYEDIGGEWGWPTNRPAIITSRFGWRWGKVHQGLDISGTGFGSPIYAIGDGEVVKAAYACAKPCSQWASGTHVIIKHDNGYYSSYLHMSGLNVKEGDRVSRGQRIGSMGETGWATGVHVHLGFFSGYPSTNNALDPLKIYPGIK